MNVFEGVRVDGEEKAAAFLENQISRAIVNRGKAVLGVVGGSSVSGVLKILDSKSLDWSKVRVFLLDERIVDLESQGSNYRVVRDSLRNGTLYSCNSEDNLEEYIGVFEEAGGRFDVILLSSGEDGHVASLFPNKFSLEEPKDKFFLVEDSPKPPKRRISAGPKLIGKSRSCVLLFFGEGKKDAYDAFGGEDIKIKDSPNKIVKGIEDLLVIVSVS